MYILIRGKFLKELCFILKGLKGWIFMFRKLEFRMKDVPVFSVFFKSFASTLITYLCCFYLTVFFIWLNSLSREKVIKLHVELKVIVFKIFLPWYLGLILNRLQWTTQPTWSRWPDFIFFISTLQVTYASVSMFKNQTQTNTITPNCYNVTILHTSYIT